MLQHPLLHEGSNAARVSTLPLRAGGLGLRSAVRTAPGAYWAAWADALPMIQARHPALATRLVAELANSDGSNADCIQQASDAGRLLDHRGFDRPAWHLLAAGARPPLRDELPEPCERVRGWQFHACSAIETFHREQALLPVLPPAHRALLRSSSGSGAAHWRFALPTSPEATMRPEVM